MFEIKEACDLPDGTVVFFFFFWNNRLSPGCICVKRQSSCYEEIIKWGSRVL